MSEPTLNAPASDDSPRLDTVVLALVLLAYLFTAERVDENIRTAGSALCMIAAVFNRHVAVRWWAWAGLVVLLAAGIAMRPIDVPNHHYMLAYLCAAVAVSLTASSPAARRAALNGNGRWLIVALMGIATIQRLFQPDFLNGAYLGYELSRGGFGGPVLARIGDVAATNAANDAAIHAFRATPPAEAQSVTLSPHILTGGPVAMLFMVSILAIEAVICVAFLLLPRKLLPHVALLAFAGSLVALRQEVTFISVVCVLGLLATTPDRPRLRVIYAGAAMVFAALVLKTLNTPAL